ncbi:hypothetical protein Dimus_029352, partial [Dionaea muscipula]
LGWQLHKFRRKVAYSLHESDSGRQTSSLVAVKTQAATSWLVVASSESDVEFLLHISDSGSSSHITADFFKIEDMNSIDD